MEVPGWMTIHDPGTPPMRRCVLTLRVHDDTLSIEESKAIVNAIEQYLDMEDSDCIQWVLHQGPHTLYDGSIGG